MKLLFASDSFKGSLTSEQTIELLRKAANEVFGEGDYIGIPVADGGEGTVDALLTATDGEKVYVNVHDPLMNPIQAYYGKTRQVPKLCLHESRDLASDSLWAEQTGETSKSTKLCMNESRDLASNSLWAEQTGETSKSTKLRMNESRDLASDSLRVEQTGETNQVSEQPSFKHDHVPDGVESDSSLIPFDDIMRKVERFKKLSDGSNGLISDCRCAIIEMAAASGLSLVPMDNRNPLYTTSYGTGELIRHALEQGYREIYIAIGGCATNDGGMGCARALGVRFLDANDRELEGRGIDLERVSRVDMTGLDSRIKNTRITLMCDVKNPLCGEQGATYTFSAQKGATREIQERLEQGMCNYRDVIRRQFGIDPDTLPGSGAAGGLGAALQVFLGTEMKSGIETVLDLTDFDHRLDGVDLVVTGEGRTDWQSCYGKVMQGVGQRAKAKGIPVVGLCGSLGTGALQILDYGIDSLMTTVDSPMTLEEAMDRAEELYYQAAVRMFKLIQIGRKMKENGI